MKKVLKIITSKYIITAILIISEIVFLVLLNKYLADAYFPVRIASYIISVISILIVINRDTIWETKAPWVITILLLQPFGSFIYLILGVRYSTIKERKFIKRIEYMNQDDKVYNEPILEELKNEDIEAYGKANQLVNEANALIRKDNDIIFYDSGEAFLEHFYDSLRSAKHFIFMEFFIVSNGKVLEEVEKILVEKHKEGVEIRFMYDDIGSYAALQNNYYKHLRKLGIEANCFARFHMMASSSHNNRNHRKIVVIDGKVAFTGGINLADEYFNIITRFGYWKDSVVEITGSAVGDYTRQFLFDWDWNSNTTTEWRKYVLIPEEKMVPGYIIPFGSGVAPLYEREIPKHTFLNLINQAKYSIKLTTPYLINDREMMNALENAGKRGVNVEIITPHIPDKKITFTLTRSSYGPLIKSGVHIYEYTPGFIHEKLFICDDIYALTGTLNYDYRCFLHHFENALWIYKHPVINDMIIDFNNSKSKSEEITIEMTKRKWITRLFVTIIRIFSPFF